MTTITKSRKGPARTEARKAKMSANYPNTKKALRRERAYARGGPRPKTA